MKLYSVVVVGGIVALLAWNANGRSERAAAARVSAISTYHLDQRQGNVYDECLVALARKHLRNGGSNESYCGCFASTAADDESGTNGIDILRQAASGDVSSKMHEIQAHMASHDMRYLAAFTKTTTAALACANDQQHVFTSNEERLTWCQAKPERATDDRCRRGPG